MVRCKGIKEDGSQCTFKTKNNKLTCIRHDSNKINPTCSGKKTRGGKCTRTVNNEGDRCRDHQKGPKCNEPNSKKERGLCKNKVDNEGDKCIMHGGQKKIKEVNKDERTVIYCPKCKKKETWKYMKPHGFSNYEVSSIGRFYNIKRCKLLAIDLKPISTGYVRAELINDDGDRKSKNISTWLGGVFFNIKLVYGKEYNTITADHINRVKTDNYVCCNLRVATKSEQCLNQEKSEFNNGKIVFKISPNDGTILEKYTSIKQASIDLSCQLDTITRLCKSGKEVDGYKLRFMIREDLGKDKWVSSESLYPEYQPSFWVSTGGWTERSDGRLTQGSLRGKYFRMGITINHDETTVRDVHVVVWEIINDKKVPKGMEISHIDDDGENNRIENLELNTHTGNMRNMIRLGMRGMSIKVKQIFHDSTPSRIYFNKTEACLKNSIEIRTLNKVIRGEKQGAGLCKCGLLYSWEKII